MFPKGNARGSLGIPSPKFLKVRSKVSKGENHHGH